MQQKNVKLFIYPLISLGIFIVLVFGAAYAYIAGTITMNTSNYQVTLPQQTSLVCTKTDCGVTITPSQMARANNSTTAKSSNMCSVNCTCSGAQGAVCAYNVFVVEAGTSYVPSSSLGTNKEFTVTVSNPTGCSNPSTNNTTHYNSSVETQVNTVNSKIVSNCTLTVPQSGSISANVTAEFKWYNLDIPQDGHASKTYKYQLSTGTEIPDAYQQVEYIQGTGTQYIDTKYPIHMNWKYTITFQQTDTGTYRSWGAFNQSSYIGPNASLTYVSGSPGKFVIRWETVANSQRYVELGNIDTSKHTVVINNGAISFDGVSKGTSAGHSSSFVSTVNAYLFTINPGNTTPSATLKGKIYYYEVRDNNNNLVQKLIPCYRKLDNVIGMYDVVNGTFHTNIGSGNFTKGSNV